MGVTRMACPPPASDQEAALLRAFDATRGFRLEGASLVLLAADGAPLATLHRRP